MYSEAAVLLPRFLYLRKKYTDCETQSVYFYKLLLTTTIITTAAAIAIAAIAGTTVKKSGDYRHGRGLPYNRGNGVTVSYNRRLARIIGYV